MLTGTIFHGTKIPVRTWLVVIFEMCASKNGVADREIERKYDLMPKSAWFMTHRIREAMKREPLAGLLGGAVQVDETWIGGEPKNRHRNDPREQPHAWHTSDNSPSSRSSTTRRARCTRGGREICGRRRLHDGPCLACHHGTGSPCSRSPCGVGDGVRVRRPQTWRCSGTLRTMSTSTDLLAALAAIDSEIKVAEERVADLRLERRGAEALLKRLGVSMVVDAPVVTDPPTQSEPAPELEAHRSLSTGNAKYVADILATDPGGLTLAVIESKSIATGHPLNYDQVRSAVTYLKRKGLAEQAGRGIWRLAVPAESPPDADSPAEGAGLSVLPIPTTEGGDAGAETTTDREDQLSRWNNRDGHHPSVMEG